MDTYSVDILNIKKDEDLVQIKMRLVKALNLNVEVAQKILSTLPVCFQEGLSKQKADDLCSLLSSLGLEASMHIESPLSLSFDESSEGTVSSDIVRDSNYDFPEVPETTTSEAIYEEPILNSTIDKQEESSFENESSISKEPEVPNKVEEKTFPAAFAKATASSERVYSPPPRVYSEKLSYSELKAKRSYLGFFADKKLPVIASIGLLLIVALCSAPDIPQETQIEIKPEAISKLLKEQQNIVPQVNEAIVVEQKKEEFMLDIKGESFIGKIQIEYLNSMPSKANVEIQGTKPTARTEQDVVKGIEQIWLNKYECTLESPATALTLAEATAQQNEMIGIGRAYLTINSKKERTLENSKLVLKYSNPNESNHALLSGELIIGDTNENPENAASDFQIIHNQDHTTSLKLYKKFEVQSQ